MGADRNFYYDFGAERVLDGWEVIAKDGEFFEVGCAFVVEADGDYVLLFAHVNKFDAYNLVPVSLLVDGKESRFDRDADSAYVWEHGSRYGITARLAAGNHALRLKLRSPFADPCPQLRVALVPDLPPAPLAPECRRRFVTPPMAVWPESGETADLTGHTPGAGHGKTPGRFGFSKGDGVLDCAMPFLGVVDKMYLCGHPRYKKPFKWTYSLLPPEARLHGSFAPAQVGVEDDQLDVNHLSVNWRARFGATSFACTYSLGSPGILAESSEPRMAVSMLERAGNYRWLMIPRGAEIEVASLRGGMDIAMAENWLLLFGATEFPDIPLLLVFDRQPERLEVRRNTAGRLAALEFHGVSLLLAATPFGIESKEPTAPDDAAFLADAVERCRFWSRALLAYPTKCEEYFKLDEQNQKVEIVQKFSYRIIPDQWGTKPLRTAPLPPPTGLCGTAEFLGAATDFKFPTKYGPLRGAVGGDAVGYRLPYMPRARRFPLKEGGEIAETLAGDMDSFFAFHENFPDTDQAYPYAGSLLEPYAWSCSLLNFMDKPAREKLRKLAATRLAAACDPARKYRYPVIDWGTMMREMPDRGRVLEIYRDPDLRHMELHNWYSRTEPFTGAQYKICYLNVGLFIGGVIKTGAPDEVADLKLPLIENDWGAGLAFYYMYLAALAAGSFAPIKENWGLLQEAFAFFDKLHDWACMGTGYSDNAITWVEGANYGVFTAYAHMAEAVGDHAAYELGVYLAAKQLALRLAIFRSSQTYFHRYFDHAPWHVTKCFHEEDNPAHAFQNLPPLWDDRYRSQGIYNLTTEGLYPELFEALRRFAPDDLREVETLFAEAAAGGYRDGDSTWIDTQESCSMLVAGALDESRPPEEFAKALREVERRGDLIRGWRGIHIFSRALPENYFKCQLQAWAASREHPLWLEHWENLLVDRAEFDRKKGAAVVEFRLNGPSGKLRCGVRRPPREIALNGEARHGRTTADGRLELTLTAGGVLEFYF